MSASSASDVSASWVFDAIGTPWRIETDRPLGDDARAAVRFLRANAADTVDANCAAVLLRHLGDRSDCDVDMRGRYARGQMALFT